MAPATAPDWLAHRLTSDPMRIWRVRNGRATLAHRIFTIAGSERVGGSIVARLVIGGLLPEEYRVSWGKDFLTQRPEHATAIACAIAGWSVVEASLAKVFASILHASPISAVTALEDARSFERRAELVSKVASVELPLADADLIAAVLGIARPLARTRNQFAHGIWLVPAHLPDTLLLAEPNFVWALHVHGLQADTKARDALPGRLWTAMQRVENAKPYALAELRDVVDRIGEAGDLVTALSNCVGKPGLAPEDQATLRTFLTSHEGVAAALRDRAARRSRDASKASAGEKKTVNQRAKGEEAV